jgi:hypothetical protein
MLTLYLKSKMAKTTYSTITAIASYITTQLDITSTANRKYTITLESVHTTDVHRPAF